MNYVFIQMSKMVLCPADYLERARGVVLVLDLDVDDGAQRLALV